ncbi:hypothetical protein D8674_013267 [Pyrus ussuriensis x Pyrus communis]|uniref:Uncharacterized protein n=1 Tax=Pyrus ussuriensis x Pyrus communis TaxID=2448454 RepID=A0A5N5GQ42_9ROSA|nr:hypothetical protein D8674_013267 [Pyrus ussuriensis x Pyrus communis]
MKYLIAFLVMSKMSTLKVAPASLACSVALHVSARRPKKNTQGPCHQLKMVKVTWVTNERITIGYDDGHQAASTAEQHSALAHDNGQVVQTYCPMQWKSWKVMPNKVRMKMRSYLSTNYNFDDINDDMLAYVNRLFAERYKQWKSDLYQYFETFDDLQVTLEEGCPKEFEDREENSKKVKANKINRGKKTLLHHSGSRPFSYRMEARRQSQLSLIVHALSQSNIHLLDIHPLSTSEPLQPEHA